MVALQVLAREEKEAIPLGAGLPGTRAWDWQLVLPQLLARPTWTWRLRQATSGCHGGCVGAPSPCCGGDISLRPSFRS